MSHTPTPLNGDGPLVNLLLIIAGAFGWVFTSSHMSALYFGVLIPPAVWHLHAWFKNEILKK